MLSFKQFLKGLVSEATLAYGTDENKGERYANKYLQPYIDRKEVGSHKLSSDISHIKSNEQVTIHSHGIDEKGKRYAEISNTTEPHKKIKVPFTKIIKPKGKDNKGFSFENEIVSKLNNHGLMHGTGAGATAGNDFHLINKKTGEVHEGKLAENIHQGEAKKDLSAAFGQASLKYHPEKGWHFEEKTLKRFPEYTKAVHNATINIDGKPKKLMDHINDTFGPLEKGKKSNKNIYSSDTDLHPMNSYLKDHHVDVLHVGSHGTFAAGLSHENDRTGISLPKTEGTGRFRVRQKHPTSLTVQFNVKKLNKSHVDLNNDDGISYLKKKLGHE